MGDEEKELVWIMTTKASCTCPDKEDAHYKCKCKAKPGLTDPLQMYSLFEVKSSEGAGEDAILNCVCTDKNYEQPIDFLADFSHVSGHGPANDAPSMLTNPSKTPHSTGFEVGQEVQRIRKYTMQVNKRGGEDVGGQDFCSDLSDLEYMNEAGILHCLRMRFCDGDIHASMVKAKYVTFIGDICVAVNPFAPYPYAKSTAWVQYDKKNNPDVNHYKFESYLKATPDVRSNKDLQPHCWSVADLAYNTMQKTSPWKNQAVLICGESGAGKTECCKFVLDYLLAKKGSSVDQLQEKLIATNEPLESFGNAKTQNNDNSSRFAKCMQLAFDKDGKVLGAEIQTSLLEKARVCAIMPNERGFHIFFMIAHYCQEEGNVVGDGKQDTDNTDAKDMLGDMAYKYMKQIGEYPVREFAFTQEAWNVGGAGGNWPAQDIAEFKKVMYSFRSQLGYSKEDTDQMMRILVGILYLGQCQFEGDGSSGPAKVSNPDMLNIAAECLGLDPAGMAENLGKYQILMGKDWNDKYMTAAKSRSVRDSICKKLFDSTFLDIVAHCNSSVVGESLNQGKKKARIGVLDIFGFERMALNSLEQLCINYTNEKLHQTFINEVFQAEIRTYVSEGQSADAIKFTDNAAVLECISGYNPHKDGLTAKSPEVVRSIFGHMDTETLGSKGQEKKVPAFMEAIMKDPSTEASAGKVGPAGITKGHKQWKDDMWKGWGVKNGGWKGAYDDNGPLFQHEGSGKDKFWTLPRSDKQCKFAVVHFAGPVEYTTYAVVKQAKGGKFECVPNEEEEDRDIIDSFITKNADKIEETVRQFFFDGNPSTNDFYNSIAAPGGAAGQTNVGSTGTAEATTKTTACNKFCKEINAFFDSLLGTGSNKVAPTFIRAINPRPKGIGAPETMGERYNLQRVLNQLRYTGILDTVRVRASGYIIRKKFGEFAKQYIFPCNILAEIGEAAALQGDMQDDDFAESLLNDPNKAWQVIEKLFKHAPFEIAGEKVGWLKGKTMVFVKTTSTLALLDKKREELMKEVIIRREAARNMIAKSISTLRNDPLQAQVDAVNTINRLMFKCGSGSPVVAYFTYKKWKETAADIKMLGQRKAISEAWGLALLARTRYGNLLEEQRLERERIERERIEAELRAEYERNLVVATAYGRGLVARCKYGDTRAAVILARATFYGEAWSKGLVARMKWKVEKAKLVESGDWQVGGASLIKRRKPKAAIRTASDQVNFDKQAATFSAAMNSQDSQAHIQKAREAGAKVLSPHTISMALKEGAQVAASKCPRTTDPGKLKMRTRDYLGGETKTRLVAAMQGLNKDRPADVHDYLAYTMKNGAVPTNFKSLGHKGNVYEYINDMGIFGLLRPALLCCDKDRPDDPGKYLAEFLSGAIEKL